MFDYYLDLSSTNSGVVLVGEKVIYITSWNFSKFKKKSKIKVEWQIEKMRYISTYINDFIKKYPPKSFTAEGIFIKKEFLASSETLMKVHGMVIEKFINYPIKYIPPTNIKKNITGKGNASKELIRQNICKKLNIQGINYDEADALALMLTDKNLSDFQSLEKQIIYLEEKND